MSLGVVISGYRNDFGIALNQYIASQHSRLTDMHAYHFDVYDIDVTMTIPGHDVRYLSTRSLSADKDLSDSMLANGRPKFRAGWTLLSVL
jgi:hypothetical protein